jgi:hypothetical protein
MTEETEKRYCRVCDRELEIIPEEQEDNHPYIPLYYCEDCNKHYRFVEVD